jgi:hypothetical protein
VPETVTSSYRPERVFPERRLTQGGPQTALPQSREAPRESDDPQRLTTVEVGDVLHGGAAPDPCPAQQYVQQGLGSGGTAFRS